MSEEKTEVFTVQKESVIGHRGGFKVWLSGIDVMLSVVR